MCTVLKVSLGKKKQQKTSAHLSGASFFFFLTRTNSFLDQQETFSINPASCHGGPLVRAIETGGRLLRVTGGG